MDQAANAAHAAVCSRDKCRLLKFLNPTRIFSRAFCVQPNAQLSPEQLQHQNVPLFDITLLAVWPGPLSLPEPVSCKPSMMCKVGWQSRTQPQIIFVIGPSELWSSSIAMHQVCKQAPCKLSSRQGTQWVRSAGALSGAAPAELNQESAADDLQQTGRHQQKRCCPALDGPIGCSLPNFISSGIR